MIKTSYELTIFCMEDKIGIFIPAKLVKIAIKISYLQLIVHVRVEKALSTQG